MINVAAVRVSVYNGKFCSSSSTAAHSALGLPCACVHAHHRSIYREAKSRMVKSDVGMSMVCDCYQ